MILKYFKFRLSAKAISSSVIMPEDAVPIAFGDGRVASRFSECFSEYWVEHFYGWEKCKNSNQAGFDNICKTSSGDLLVSVRCLTLNGISFQQSSYLGSGRSNSLDTLKKSLDDIHIVVVIDVTGFPWIRMLPIKRDDLLCLLNEGKLPKSRMSQNCFYKVVVDRFYPDIQWTCVEDILTYNIDDGSGISRY